MSLNVLRCLKHVFVAAHRPPDVTSPQPDASLLDDVRGTSNEAVYMEDYDDDVSTHLSSGRADERGSQTSSSQQSETLEHQLNEKTNDLLEPSSQPDEALYRLPMKDQSYRSDAAFDVEFQSIIKHSVEAVIRWEEPCSDLSKSRASHAQGHVMYTVRYHPQSSPELYAEKNSVLNFVLLDNLRPNEKYVYKVKRVQTGSGHTSRERLDGGVSPEEKWSHEGLLDTSYPDR